ncbi:class I SAM-dependent methyltransferase [Jatrophihabitans sp.]|jgi:16S rRNA (guanine1207-N2)-methyltransferase|uniref:class I SAM-dependent methyltransferase n=1 Tax=Jatrophihabitans sp. TaxID=1932789 RepID=UPI002EE9AA3C
MTGFDFGRLRRFPDVEAANLFAADATDRLLLDTAASSVAAAGPGEVVVVGDHYGALTLGTAARFGCAGIRSHTDALTGELARALNADRLGLAGSYADCSLSAELFAGARVVLAQAPKGLDELAEWVGLIGRHADPSVRVFLGGRVKYLTPSMNDVLSSAFETVTAGLARQKSRVIEASGLRRDLPVSLMPEFPRREWHADFGMWVCAHGGAFSGTAIDLGTRRLLGVLSELPDAGSAIDLGCGTGVLAVALARRGVRVLASDSSAAAVRSCSATAEANGLAELVTVRRDDALGSVASDSASLIVCNPPFHLGGAVHAGAAVKLFEAASRVLAPGGELWTVFNSHLGYLPTLRRLVGATRVVHRDPKFTVTVSVRR